MLRLSFCALVLAAGCGGNEAGQVATAPAASLVKLSGDGQTGTAGAALAAPLVVQVLDANGNPFAGFTIAWAAPAGGSIAAATNTTGPDGKASMTATLGKVAGANSFTATGAGLSGSVATFTENGAPGDATAFQVAFPISVATQVPHAASVTARDANGNSTSFHGTVDVTFGEPDTGSGALLPAGVALDITPTVPGAIPNITFATAVTLPPLQSVVVTDAKNPALTGAQTGITVTPAGSVTTLAAAPTSSSFGETVVFTAQVAGVPSGVPTGTVSFVDGATTLGTATLIGGTATFSTASLAAGTHSIRVDYAGDTNFAASSSATQPLSFVVDPATTTVSLATSATPASFGVAVTFTAAIAVATGAGTPTGTVSFTDGGAPMAGCSSVALTALLRATCTTTTLAVGAHIIAATLTADANFLGSSNAVTQTVDKGTTTTVVTTSGSPSVFGNSVTFTASIAVTAGAGAPTGTVAFNDGALPIAGCTAVALTAGSQAVCTSALAAGSHTITAAFAGDANFAGSLGTVPQTVDKATTSVTVTSSLSPSAFGNSVTFTASIAVLTGAGTPTGTVTFAEGASPLIGCAGVALNAALKATCTLSTLSVGSHGITATLAADANFTGSSGSVVQAVNPGTTTTAVLSSNPTSSFGNSVTFTATVAVASGAGALTGTVSFTDTVGAGAPTAISGCNAVALTGTLSATCTTSTLSVATHTITANYSSDPDFSGSSGTVAQAVNPGTTGIVVVSSSGNPSAPVTFGTSLSFTATVAVTAGTGTPSGTVSFVDAVGAGSPGAISPACTSVALNTTTRQATCSTASLTPGAHTITATFTNANGNFAGSSGTVTQTVNQAATTTVSANGTATFGASATFSATVSASVSASAGTPTGTVSFVDTAFGVALCTATLNTSNPPTASCSSSALPQAGAHTITATYSGDADFATSSTTFQETANEAATTTSITSTSLNAISTFGQSVTFTATVAFTSAVGGPIGIVTFTDLPTGGTASRLCTAVLDSTHKAICTVSKVNAGVHTIAAAFLDDGNFLGSTGTVAQEVLAANVLVAVNVGGTPTASSAPFGTAVTFTAALTPIPPTTAVTGTVVFMDTSTNTTLGGASCPSTIVSNQAHCTISTLDVAHSPHSIVATFNPDTGNFVGPDDSPAFTETITQAATTTTFAFSQPGGAGTPVVLTATVAGSPDAVLPPSGQVTFTAGAINATCALTSLTASTATCTKSITVPPGATTFGASYGGDANYLGSSAASQTDTVQSAPPGPAAAAILGGPLDGKVFIAAVSQDATPSRATLLYEPATSVMTPGPQLAAPRAFLTATAIGNGLVLLAGGNASGGSTFELCSFGAGASCSPTGSLSTRRCNAAAALEGSSVLVAGGDDCSANATALASWDLWSADAIVSSTAANQMTEPRASPTVTVLGGGAILLAGGATADVFQGNAIVRTARMSTVRSGHSATLLPAGSKACASGACVFVAGGVADASAPSWEIFDVASGSFGRAANAPELSNPLLARHATALLADGRVLLAGGVALDRAIASTETFDGIAFKSGPPLQSARTGAAAAYVPSLDLLVLSDGRQPPELITAP
ncbi:MAG TPA: Ig-like domain-containing protein [Myxococcales bacterium]|jgi:hypothetical protein